PRFFTRCNEFIAPLLSRYLRMRGDRPVFGRPRSCRPVIPSIRSLRWDRHPAGIGLTVGSVIGGLVVAAGCGSSGRHKGRGPEAWIMNRDRANRVRVLHGGSINGGAWQPGNDRARLGALRWGGAGLLGSDRGA